MSMRETTVGHSPEALPQRIGHAFHATRWHCVLLIGVSLLLLAPASLKAAQPLPQIGFGFAGRPVFGQRDLFQIIETTFNYMLNEHVNVHVFFAHAFGDSIIDHLYTGDDANFGFVELNLKL